MTGGGSVDTVAASPWHAGELAMQRRVGVVTRMEAVGRRNIRDHLIDQHRAFFPLLPFVVVGAVDGDGDAWATLVAGRPGFLEAPDPFTLRATARRMHDDPADAGLGDGDSIGLLGLEPSMRRRNRLNGTVHRTGNAGFDVRVAQSYGNCPQYIRRRDNYFARDPDTASPAPARRSDSLDERCRAMIAAADTFFIASYVETEQGARQVDVSHRGGRPGFVRVGADGRLTVPDFAGNLFFNTLGNIVSNPRCGFTFVDFATGDLLQLSGDGEVITDAPEIAAFQGAERLLRFMPRRIVSRDGALALRMQALAEGVSPNATMTGTWAEADARLAAGRLATTWRRLRVAGIVRESESVRSLRLEPTDGAGLVLPRVGQHLPIRVTPAGAAVPLVRTYTLSSAPSDALYRISVKREGMVSRHLHALVVGDIVEARAPAGAFTIEADEERPAVLIAAGIGITPILAMLRHLVHEGFRKRRMRPTTLFYAARSKADRAFDAEIAALHAATSGAFRTVRALSDVTGADAHEYEARRIDMDLLRAHLAFDACDFYLCGPGAFMQAIHDGLRDLDVADRRIHAEAFGPASLRRRAEPGTLPRSLPAAALEPVPVTFAASGGDAVWQPGAGSLLDLAEASNLTPAFSCRAGSCGTCRTRVLSGAVTYVEAPTAEVASDEALICCAVPAAGSENSLRLNL